jgi:DNA-binding response OmpR family regulator
MHGDRERAMGAGFDAYITKPVDLAGLREQIRLLLANR